MGIMMQKAMIMFPFEKVYFSICISLNFERLASVITITWELYANARYWIFTSLKTQEILVLLVQGLLQVYRESLRLSAFQWSL